MGRSVAVTSDNADTACLAGIDAENTFAGHLVISSGESAFWT